MLPGARRAFQSLLHQGPISLVVIVGSLSALRMVIAEVGPLGGLAGTDEPVALKKIEGIGTRRGACASVERLQPGQPVGSGRGDVASCGAALSVSSPSISISPSMQWLEIEAYGEAQPQTKIESAWD